MNRNSLMEMSGRVMHVVQRFTLNQGNDNPMMQELHLDGMNTEFRNAVERVQAFGFTSTPLPRDQDSGSGSGAGGGGGAGGDSAPMKGPAAEGICLYVGGQRNHPVCIAIDDRRHRPMGLKPGENAQYDDQGQMTLLRRNGLFLLSLDDDGSGSAPGARMLRDAEGKATGQSQQQERMVSLRHVEKKQQQRPAQQGSQGGGSSGGGAQQPAQKPQDYKHEGDTVNTEIRATKGRIEFRSGDDVVGYYDKGSKTWCFIGNIVTLQATDHVETVGKTRLGLEKPNETGPLVETVSGPALQTFAKV